MEVVEDFEPRPHKAASFLWLKEKRRCRNGTERYKYSAGKEDQGAVALVLDLAKAFERAGLPVVLGFGN